MVLLVLVCACKGSSELPEPDPDSQVPIALSSSLVSDATRGIVSNLTELQTASGTNGIGVYGYKKSHAANETGNSFSGAVTQIFTNQNVTYSSSNWTYSPTKYWDKNSYYYFVAYWPHLGTDSGSSPYVSETNHVLTINDVPNWQCADGSEKDILTDASEGAGVNYVKDSLCTVKFRFRHLLARVQIKAYYIGDQEVQVTVKNLKFGANETEHKVPTSSGSVDFTRDYTAASNTVSEGVVTMGGPHDLISSNVQIPKTAFCSDDSDPTSLVFPGYPAAPDPNHVDGGKYDVCTWLVVPFTATSDEHESIPIKVSYWIGEVQGDPIESDAKLTGCKNMAAGNSYELTLKFDTNSQGIECQSVYVKNWESGPSEGKQVFNW